MTMASLIMPGRIIPSLRSHSAKHVIAQMSRVAAEEASLNSYAVLQAIAARGEHSTFGFGRGTAIPHALLSGLKQPLGVFARLWPAQEFDAPDGMPSDLAFLLLSPEGDDSTHLRALACVVRRLRDPLVAECLRSAADAEALYAVLTSDVWREPDDKPGTGHSATPPAGDLTNGAMCTTFNVLC
ncbi:PTS sugar transporter subunit IIA [Microvirga sp. BT689]|uniref:PTS sugar transporter subunit IIA n=1 Tax=Microvirga arvi TaxID=2778731 RepID=UPI00194EEF3A|nr:PTS sugar transporter subunit IIA [Microvirga arvi]MBM6581723.1 PTS sugar transporter subunit IIA [Microvirga arvi]